jgi:metal-responsive CopG/Arc/MetJ family transcriptional regulator
MVRQQISISVPEELHERLEEYRDILNLSEIFRDALVVKLGEIEARRKDPKTMTLIERLKKEKKELEDESIQAGKSYFDQYLENLPYEQFKKLAEIVITTEIQVIHYRRPQLPAPPAAVHTLDTPPDDLWNQVCKITETNYRDWKKALKGWDKGQFIIGFLDRAKERWGEIQEKLND